MSAEKPLSPATTAVLKAVADRVRHGFDIMDATGLASGTVYPILGRLERANLLKARWEAPGVAQREKRPPRRYYEITGAGSRTLSRSISYYRNLGGMLPASGRLSHG
jgi:DNA-binding PadR family transcriptional regulator